MTTCIRRPHSVWTTCPCDPCSVDRRRTTKLARNGLLPRVPSDAALAVVAALRERGWTAHAIGSAAGLHYRTVDIDTRGRGYAPKIAAAIVNHGDPTAGSVGSAGTIRRLQGLARQGYDLQTIADATGIAFSTLAAIRSGRPQRVRSRLYIQIREYTNGIGMQVGPSKPAARHAERHGWVGILAWDDIDDPAATPMGAGTSEVDRADVMADVDSWGGNATDAARVLGIERHNLQKWCQRAGHSELYRRLAAREAMHGNQWTEGAA